MLIVIFILAVFFAGNMGGATFAVAFATAYGSKTLSRNTAGFIFIVFVILGAVVLGGGVSKTLGQSIVPQALLNQKALIIIFLSSGLSMFAANIMKIPQSTSLVTVAAISGIGMPGEAVNVNRILFMLPFWILLPVLSYFLAYFFGSWIYPPSKKNFWFYEKFANHQSKLKKLVIACSCYSAFSVGTNNVANVVGPLTVNADISQFAALFIFAIFYGWGAFLFSGPLQTAGNKVVPLGLTTATIISLVSSTLIILASCNGVPQSFVMLQMGAIFGISSLKHSHSATFENSLTRKTLYTWTINPMLTFFVSWMLAYNFL